MHGPQQSHQQAPSATLHGFVGAVPRYAACVQCLTVPGRLGHVFKQNGELVVHACTFRYRSWERHLIAIPLPPTVQCRCSSSLNVVATRDGTQGDT